MDKDEKAASVGSPLSRKKALLAEILRLTKYAPVNVAEDASHAELDAACEEIISLYEKREVLFAQLKEADDGSSDKEVEALAREIAAADEKNKVVFARLTKHIQDSLKTINRGKLAARYLNG